MVGLFDSVANGSAAAMQAPSTTNQTAARGYGVEQSCEKSEPRGDEKSKSSGSETSVEASAAQTAADPAYQLPAVSEGGGALGKEHEKKESESGKEPATEATSSITDEQEQKSSQSNNSNILDTNNDPTTTSTTTPNTHPNTNPNTSPNTNPNTSPTLSSLLDATLRALDRDGDGSVTRSDVTANSNSNNNNSNSNNSNSSNSNNNSNSNSNSSGDSGTGLMYSPASASPAAESQNQSQNQSQSQSQSLLLLTPQRPSQQGTAASGSEQTPPHTQQPPPPPQKTPSSAFSLGIFPGLGNSPSPGLNNNPQEVLDSDGVLFAGATRGSQVVKWGDDTRGGCLTPLSLSERLYGDGDESGDGDGDGSGRGTFSQNSSFGNLQSVVSTPIELTRIDSLWQSVSNEKVLPPSSNASRSYAGLFGADKELSALTSRASSILDVTQGTAVALLLHYKWDLQRLVVDFVENPRLVRMNIGLGLRAEPFLR